MKVGTDIDKINKDIGSVNTLKLVNYFHFQVMPLKNISRFIHVTLHNLLTYMMTLYHNNTNGV